MNIDKKYYCSIDSANGFDKSVINIWATDSTNSTNPIVISITPKNPNIYYRYYIIQSRKTKIYKLKMII